MFVKKFRIATILYLLYTFLAKNLQTIQTFKMESLATKLVEKKMKSEMKKMQDQVIPEGEGPTRRGIIPTHKAIPARSSHTSLGHCSNVTRGKQDEL